MTTAIHGLNGALQSVGTAKHSAFSFSETQVGELAQLYGQIEGLVLMDLGDGSFVFLNGWKEKVQHLGFENSSRYVCTYAESTSTVRQYHSADLGTVSCSNSRGIV